MGNTEQLSDYERAIFNSWLEIHKRSATTMLILTAVSDGPSYSKQLHSWIDEQTDGGWDLNEKSMHRTLRRLADLDLVVASEEKGDKTGLKRKTYAITDSGQRVLSAMRNATTHR